MQANGLCAVYCSYLSEKSSNIPIRKLDFSMNLIDMKLECKRTGCGYVREIMGTKYIVTCNHILFKNPLMGSMNFILVMEY